VTTDVSIYEEQLACEIKRVPEEHLPNLLQIVRLFRESVVLKPAEASFCRGWQEGLTGETRPVSELWEGIDAHQRPNYLSREIVNR
jgi:hypothetical protein